MKPPDGAAEDECPGVLIALLPSLCCYYVASRMTSVNVAKVEHDASVAEDEIYGAVDVALSEHLRIRVGIECVLIAFEAAPVERRLV